MLSLAKVSTAGWLAAALVFSPLVAAQTEASATPYGVKGAGASDCTRFVKAVANKDKSELSSYAGWIDGYITALNMSRADTFDLAPWQSSETLLSALHNFCQQAATGKKVDVPFHVATQMMTRSLYAERLQSTTSAVIARQRDKGVVVYQYVLDQLRDKLEQQGLLVRGRAGEAFDDKTALAISAFQQREGLMQSGLPDQGTLALLLFKEL